MCFESQAESKFMLSKTLNTKWFFSLNEICISSPTFSKGLLCNECASIKAQKYLLNEHRNHWGMLNNIFPGDLQ